MSILTGVLLRAPMHLLSSAVEYVSGFVWGFPEAFPFLVAFLLGTGLYVTTRLGLIQVRRLKHAILAVMGRFDDPEDEGDINHFQALTTALSATVGIGNIAGVATAIHYGGPGAIFWMWLTAFFGMALKFSECTLALNFRGFDEHGNVAGGPMYYIERGLGKRWKPLAVLFAACAIISSFGSGNMNQSNTMAVSAQTDFGWDPLYVGIFAAVAVGAVIIGGIKRIGSVSSKLMPAMAVVYFVGAAAILLLNLSELPGAIALIFKSAFTPQASLGGSVAGGVMMTLLWGVKRGLYSNEAGQGSAPIAHAAAKTDEPVREGAVALLEPMIDTLIICTMTALVIVTTGVWDKKRDTTLPLNQLELAAATFPVDGTNTPTSTYEAVTQSTQAAAARLERLRSGEEVFAENVRQGQQAAFKFVSANGFVDNPILVSEGGEPLNGTLRWNREEGQLEFRNTEGARIEPHVRGKMLQNSSALTAWAFEKGLAPIGDWGNYIVTFSVFLFALSTMISWSYYGDRCVTYLFGSKYVMMYRLVFVTFVFMGSILALEVVWAFGDLALGLMTLPNLLAVVLLFPKLLELTKDYFARMDKEHGT